MDKAASLKVVNLHARGGPEALRDLADKMERGEVSTALVAFLVNEATPILYQCGAYRDKIFLARVVDGHVWEEYRSAY
uniref:Uncharacterized protein n=1 Tax=viral metagenome TaxID=1070528 RepID=A0A6H1ZJG2_9ZZZZ